MPDFKLWNVSICKGGHATDFWQWWGSCQSECHTKQLCSAIIPEEDESSTQTLDPIQISVRVLRLGMSVGRLLSVSEKYIKKKKKRKKGREKHCFSLAAGKCCRLWGSWVECERHMHQSIIFSQRRNILWKLSTLSKSFSKDINAK